MSFTLLEQGLINNCIENGIKKDIEIAHTAHRDRAVVLLIYAGMDAMAFLNMHINQHDVKPADFVKWSDRYIKFHGTIQLSGEDLYGARCGALHRYGIESRMSRKGKCKMFGYTTVDITPPIQASRHPSCNRVVGYHRSRGHFLVA